MRLAAAFSLLPLLASFVTASPYRAELVNYNLNTNQNAQSVLEYSTLKRSSYTPSPANWRSLPVYTILLDKFSDGDPSNNDYFGTAFESDWRETQLRYGGDLKGLVSRLDYLAGMGIKVIFISGTPFLNMLWQADSESFFFPSANRSVITSSLQATLQSTCPFLILIGELSMTGATLLTQFMLAACISWLILLLERWVISLVSKGTRSFFFGIFLILTILPSSYLNVSTPFDLNEHTAVWKNPRYMPWNFTEYADFQVRSLSLTLPLC